jgi:hypothetical protein
MCLAGLTLDAAAPSILDSTTLLGCELDPHTNQLGARRIVAPSTRLQNPAASRASICRPVPIGEQRLLTRRFAKPVYPRRSPSEQPRASTLRQSTAKERRRRPLEGFPYTVYSDVPAAQPDGSSLPDTIRAASRQVLMRLPNERFQ